MTQAKKEILELTNPIRTDYFNENGDLFFDLQMKVNAELVAFPAPNTELLVLNAPDYVNIDKQTELPAIVVRYNNGLRDWQISYALNCYILMQDLDGGALQSKILVLPGEERARPPEPSASGPKPEGLNVQSTNTSLNRYFLREQLNLNWHPARLAFTVIDYDTLSNTVSVTLDRGDTASNVSPIAVVTPSNFLSPAQTSAPETTDENPLKLSIEYSPDAKTISVEGSINASVSSLSTAVSQAGVRQPNIVLATLLFMRLDQPPLAIDLAIPAQNSGETAGEQKLSAHFSLDAAVQLPKDLPNGLYQVYLLAGLNSFGPASVLIEPNPIDAGI